MNLFVTKILIPVEKHKFNSSQRKEICQKLVLAPIAFSIILRLSFKLHQFSSVTISDDKCSRLKLFISRCLSHFFPFFTSLFPKCSAETTESELCRVFSAYGNVKSTKIIVDRAGVSKGYGFVTFETELEASRLHDVRCYKFPSNYRQRF